MAKSKSTPVRKETNKDDDDFEDIML
jgi:hypothetical protein